MFGAAALALVAGCAGLLGPRTVDVSLAQMQDAMARRFPVEKRYLEVFEVQFALPRVQLRPEVNRLSTEIDMSVRERLFGNERHGTIALNYGLRFEPSDNTVRLTDVRVDRIDVDSASALLRQQLDRIGALLVEDKLSNLPIYTLRDKDVEAIRGRGYVPTDIRVTPAGLTITLTPASAG